MRFSRLIELYVGSLDIVFQPYSLHLSHVYPCRAFIYILRSLIPFLLGGDFPPSVDILHMYPCIEHRHVLLLGTSLFSLNDTHLLLVCNYKASLFFFQAFQITEKVQKNKETKKPDKERCYLWQLSSHVTFKQSTAYHIHWLGYSLTLGAVLVYLIFISTDWLCFQSLWSLY